MKSRALPEEFPILQTLHQYNATGRIGASPTDYSPNGVPTSAGGMYQRSSGIRRHSDSSSAVAAGYPYTSSTGDLMSPISTGGDRYGNSISYLPHQQQTRSQNPFTGRSSSDAYRTHVPRLQLHETPRALSTSGDQSGSPSTYTSTLHDDYSHSSGYSLAYDHTPRSAPPPESPYVHSPASGMSSHHHYHHTSSPYTYRPLGTPATSAQC